MERAEKVVVDASVIVKWYNVEDYTENALALRGDYASRRLDLIAPHLVVYEVGNSLRYNPDFGADDVKSALRDLLAMQINLRLLDEEISEVAVDLAYKFGITFYDAVYLTLAEKEKAPLYTADERLLLKIENENIKHIGEYKASV
ncbi:MAG: type II toxin-antitoxin system VapC family toxin [Candidatus Bathyarchaeia archaeon]